MLRGVCQLPAYVAYEHNFLRDLDIDATLSLAPTAWTVPERLLSGDVQFAVIPWTRVAADPSRGNRLTLVSGSGIEEAALVVRTGKEPDEVTSVAVPQEGGIKDLTAMALVKRMGWEAAKIVRMPSGDGAILSFVGEGADAASMVEPYAAMLEHLGLGRVIQRTGDVWPNPPGCSLATTSSLIGENPSLVQRMVNAYVWGEAFTRDNPDATALPFSDACADGLVAVSLGGCLDNFPAFLTEARRVLKPGGVLLVTVSNRGSLLLRINGRLRRILDRHGDRRRYQLYGADEITGAVQEAGLRVVGVRRYGYVLNLGSRLFPPAALAERFERQSATRGSRWARNLLITAQR